MGFPWAQYLSLAEDLVGTSTNTASLEAQCRSSISRAYYAAFHHARDFLLTKIPMPTSRATHESVRLMFKSNAKKDWKHVGLQLERLHESRKHADYDNPVIYGTKKEADIAIEIAHDIIDTVNRL